MNIDELRLEFKIVEAARAWLRFDRARNYSATEWDRMIRRWVVLAWVSAAMVVVTVALLAHQWGGFAASTFAAVLTAAIQLASVVLLLFVCVRSVRGARDARRWRRMAPPVLASDQAKRELIAAVDALESTRRRRPKATTLESRRGLPRNVRGYDGGFHDLICAQSGWPGRPVPPCDCEEEPR